MQSGTSRSIAGAFLLLLSASGSTRYPKMN